MGKTMNREEIAMAAKQFNVAFANIRHVVADIIAEGDRVVMRTLDHATHVGEFRGHPATGRNVSFEMIAIYRIAGDRIEEIWELIDLPSLLQQLC